MSADTMPTPVAAELLIDDPEHGDRDERYPNVHLLEVDEDGTGKTTAERVRGGWRIAEWELTEELSGALAGSRYWFCRCFHTVPDAHLRGLVEAARAGDKPFTVCCGREECGGECGNDWNGMTSDNERLAEAGDELLALVLDGEVDADLRRRIQQHLGIDDPATYVDDLPF